MKSKKEKVIDWQSIDKLLREWKSDIIENDIIEVPEYDYGASQEPLDWAFQVRNISWWASKIKTWITPWVPSWYTNFSITWVWFKPKALQVTVLYWASTVAWGIADETNGTLTQQCVWSNSWSMDYSTSRLFRFSWTLVWDLVSFDADGFTVKSDVNCIIQWTCFW